MVKKATTTTIDPAIAAAAQAALIAQASPPQGSRENPLPDTSAIPAPANGAANGSTAANVSGPALTIGQMREGKDGRKFKIWHPLPAKLPADVSALLAAENEAYKALEKARTARETACTALFQRTANSAWHLPDNHAPIFGRSKFSGEPTVIFEPVTAGGKVARTADDNSDIAW